MMNLTLEENFRLYFSQISNIVNKIAKEKGWWDRRQNGEFRSDGELIALMHSELSEALEGLRENLQDKHCPEFKSVEIELADCIIRIMDMAKERNYRVAEAIIAKIKQNEARPHKHGGKLF